MNPAELLAFLSARGVELSVAVDRLHVDAPVGVLTPTLRAELTTHKTEIIELLRGLESAETRSAAPLQNAARQHHLPVSFAQQGLWFLDQLMPGSPVSNMNAALRLTGPLDVAALERGFNEVVRRHEALRTTFATVEGLPFQVISPALSLELPVLDLRHVPEEGRGRETLRLATEEAQRPFDLAKGPLVRTTLLRLGEEEHVLLLTMHHIISDGWSLGVFSREMTILYNAFSAGEASPLDELPIQYADFACRQRQWLQGATLESLLSYWKQQLARAPGPLELPTDRPRPPVMTFKGAHKSFTLSPTLSESLKELSRREGVTLFMTLLSAYATLLYRYTGQEDIFIGNNIAGRNRAEIAGLIGVFVNTLVIRIDLSGNPSFRELLGRVRKAALAAYDHQDLPFEKLVQELQPEFNLKHAPLAQVGFSMRNMPIPRLEFLGLTVSHMEIETGTARTDLVLFIEDGLQDEGGRQGVIEYNTDLFDSDTIDRMLERLEMVLTTMAADAEQRVNSFSLLKKGEREEGHPDKHIKGLRGDAEQLLVELDQLSAEQVDLLLNEMLAEVKGMDNPF
ncbi:MAG TPA: condensation domain-containing protein [Pyrinomonadaceae bacterium]|jgi:hypothetical protein